MPADIPWQAIVPVLIPLLGKIFLMIPFIANRAIPALLTVFAVISNYWTMAGFPTDLPPPPDVPPDPALGGFLGDIGRIGLSLGLGIVQTLYAKYFYDGRKEAARARGEISWWEKGKRSMF